MPVTDFLSIPTSSVREILSLFFFRDPVRDLFRVPGFVNADSEFILANANVLNVI